MRRRRWGAGGKQGHLPTAAPLPSLGDRLNREHGSYLHCFTGSFRAIVFEFFVAATRGHLLFNWGFAVDSVVANITTST